jgi:hypothetical protein
MFTALNPVEFAEVMSVGRHIPSEFESKTDLQKAQSLDAVGDRYKAQGKFESAKFAYARALHYAIKAGV